MSQIAPKGAQLQMLVLYALPVLPLSFLFGPLAIVQGIYAKYFGVGLTTIATVLLISRIFDAVTDPIIGYCADRYFAQGGTRKPFIIIGSILFIVSSWFLYVPFGFELFQVFPSVSNAYFLFWFLAFYLAYTLFEIPHLAWGGELADDSGEKNKVYGLRSFFLLFGGLLFFAMPLLPIFDTNEITPQTLKWSVLVASGLILPMLYLCIRYVPSSQRSKECCQHDFKISKKKLGLRSTWKSIISNKPLLVLIAAQVCTGFGSHMWFTLLFLFVDAYLNLGHQFALVYVSSFGFSMLTLKLWYALASRLGKQVTWVMGMLSVALGMVGTGVLSPNYTGMLSLLVCMTMISAGFAAFSIMVPSLLSDIIDYGTLKSGSDRAATYFSLYTFINKSVAALGGALGLALAGWYGFDPVSNMHNESTIFGLRLAVAWIPTLMILISTVLISYIPITARHHSIIQRRLDTQLRKNVISEELQGNKS